MFCLEVFTQLFHHWNLLCPLRQYTVFIDTHMSIQHNLWIQPQYELLMYHALCSYVLPQL